MWPKSATASGTAFSAPARFSTFSRSRRVWCRSLPRRIIGKAADDGAFRKLADASAAPGVRKATRRSVSPSARIHRTVSGETATIVRIDARLRGRHFRPCLNNFPRRLFRRCVKNRSVLPTEVDTIRLAEIRRAEPRQLTRGTPTPVKTFETTFISSAEGSTRHP